MGIEPTYLAWKASVLPLNYTRIFICSWNAQNRNRTSDTRIFSPLLYQLSYLGIAHSRTLFHNKMYLTRISYKCQEFLQIFFIFLFFIQKESIACYELFTIIFFHNTFRWLGIKFIIHLMCYHFFFIKLGSP